MFPIVERLPEICFDPQFVKLVPEQAATDHRFTEPVGGYSPQSGLYHFEREDGPVTVGMIWEPGIDSDPDRFLEEQTQYRDVLCKSCLLYASYLCKGLALSRLSHPNGFSGEQTYTIEYSRKEPKPQNN